MIQKILFMDGMVVLTLAVRRNVTTAIARRANTSSVYMSPVVRKSVWIVAIMVAVDAETFQEPVLGVCVQAATKRCSLKSVRLCGARSMCLVVGHAMTC